jgi:hypothetical protein
MLEQLFGSKTRVRLLRLFLRAPQEAYFVRELSRKINSQINAIRNELDNLVKMGVLVETSGPTAEVELERKVSRARGKRSTQRRYYRLNLDALLYPELRALFMKAQVLLEKDFVRKLTDAGNVSYLALSGYFVGAEDAPTDIIIVGRIGKDRCMSMIRAFEREIGRELNYTIMTPQEYKYRRDVTDRFLFSILESKKIVVLDNVSERIGIPAI